MITGLTRSQIDETDEKERGQQVEQPVLLAQLAGGQVRGCPAPVFLLYKTINPSSTMKIQVTGICNNGCKSFTRDAVKGLAGGDFASIWRGLFFGWP
jgi:hypothetical protein